MNSRKIKKILCMAALMMTYATGCGKAQTTVNTINEISSEIVGDESETQELPLSSPVTGDVSKVMAEFPDASYIDMIGDNLFVVVTYNFQNDKTEIQVYDSLNDSVVNKFSVNEVNYSIVPEIVTGQGFGVSYDYTKNGGKDNGIIGYYYNIKDNEVSQFKAEVDREWNTWYRAVFAPDGSAMYVKVDDRSICSCGYNFNPDFITRIIAAYADGSTYNIAEYDHHTVVDLIGTTDDGRLLVAYTEDPNDYPKLSHEEFERGMGAIGVEVEINEDGTATIGGLTEDLEDIEHGLAIINPAESSDHELNKIYKFSEGYCNLSYRNGSIIYRTKDTIVRLTPDASGQLTEVEYEVNVPDDVEYEKYNEQYVSPNGDYVVFTARYKDRSGCNLYVIHFDEDKVETVLRKANDGQNIELRHYYGPVILDEKTGTFFAGYDDTATENWDHLPYQVTITN